MGAMTEVIPNNLLYEMRKGECVTVELKKCRNKLPSSLFESICGMLNRSGGHIFLGVENDGEVSGVSNNAVKEMKKDFANTCNNPQKIFPAVHLEIHDYIVNDKTVLYIYVYESSDVHRTVNKIFDRNEDGDFDITANTHLISQMYIRKSNTYIENKIFPYAKVKDLRKDLIDRARKLAINRDANHPWARMSDMELLKSAGLYERDLQTGEEGINLAGILLLGKDETISSALSYYRTDAILRVKDLERYDDRDDIRTNLLDSYDRLIEFLQKHTNEKFYIENGQRINIRNIIAREICANMLIHREYSNPASAQLVITKETVTTTNANKPRFIGYIDASNFSPFPKNPKIAGFFKEIGYADELGSGIKKIAKYAKIYSGVDSAFREGELFEAVVYLPNSGVRQKRDNLRGEVVGFIASRNGVNRKEIDRFAYPLLDGLDESQKDSRVSNLVASLSRAGIIENRGSKKYPKWVYSDSL